MGGGVKPLGATVGDRPAVQKRSDAQHVQERSQRTCLERSLLGSPLSSSFVCLGGYRAHGRRLAFVLPTCKIFYLSGRDKEKEHCSCSVTVCAGLQSVALAARVCCWWLPDSLCICLPWDTYRTAVASDVQVVRGYLAWRLVLSLG